MRLFNTLGRQIQPLQPIDPGQVRIYSCGPTVYRFVHIGNLRTYLMADWLRRTLEHAGYQVTQIKNITDVGHMRQEMVDRGEDKMIAAALAEGKTPGQIAEFYTEAFHRDEARLNIRPADRFPKATDHVPEMIAMSQRLIARGHAYEAGGNVYFDVASFPAYGELSGNQLQNLLKGVRVEVDPLKRNPTDFALWKAAEPGRMVKWPSPWGEGFPGWHIECSAMSTRYLGPRFDIHTGGVDNIFPHHEDEKAQSEAATGERFVNTWVHAQHLLADGLKMAKSTGNAYTLSDVEQRGFEPLTFRYLCLTVHYRSRMNFTFAALRAAEQAFYRLRQRVRRASLESGQGGEDEAALDSWRRVFWERAEDDLDLPGALAVIWRVLHAGLAPAGELRLLLEFDTLLGLELAATARRLQEVPAPVAMEVSRRAELRSRADFDEADRSRTALGERGWQLEDARRDTLAWPAEVMRTPHAGQRTISSRKEVPSLIDEPDRRRFSVVLVSNDYAEDTRRCVESALAHADGLDVEVVVVDNGSPPELGRWLDALAEGDARVRVEHVDHRLGEAEARNLGITRALGGILILLDTSVEVTGDIYTPIEATLASDHVGLTGPWGISTGDLRHFEAEPSGEVDAIEAYCMAFPRSLAREVGLMNERFRFYRILDIDYSFAFKARGYHPSVIPDLPVERHEHRVWESLSDEERNKRSKQNFDFFLHRWGQRPDLLVNADRPHHH